jgi:rubredoxin
MQGAEVDRWICTICDYIYDPTEGDGTQGILPGVPFTELPDGWVCPVCGAPVEDFDKLPD